MTGGFSPAESLSDLVLRGASTVQTCIEFLRAKIEAAPTKALHYDLIRPMITFWIAHGLYNVWFESVSFTSWVGLLCALPLEFRTFLTGGSCVDINCSSTRHSLQHAVDYVNVLLTGHPSISNTRWLVDHL
jgi:hypothetical protein